MILWGKDDFKMLGESILSYLVLTIKKPVGHESYFIKQLITWKTLPYSGK